MLRNRITAKISRDKKKKELEELSALSKNLINENYMLNQELEKKEREIQFFKTTSNSLCNNCKQMLLTKNLQEPCKTIFSMNDVTEEGKSNFSNYLKYSVYTSFLVVMCIIGAFSLPILSPEAIANVTQSSSSVIHTMNNNAQNAPRILLSLPVNSDKQENIDVKNNTATVPTNKTSTDLVLMEKLIQIYKPKEYYNTQKPLYEITKDNEFLKYIQLSLR